MTYINKNLSDADRKYVEKFLTREARKEKMQKGIIRTASAACSLVKLLAIIGTLAYSYQNREKIEKGLSGIFTSVQSVQATFDVGNSTNDNSFLDRVKQQNAEYHKMGIENPRVRWVRPDDPNWEEAKADWAETKKDLRAAGIDPHIKHVSRGDPEWKEACAQFREIIKSSGGR